MEAKKLNMSKKFPVLYKYTTRGQAQQWQIVVEEDKFYTIEGMVDGKLTTSLPTVCKPKNVGRANETTPEGQALAEATAKHQKKLDKGYDTKLTEGVGYFEPMLAHDYKKVSIDWKKDKVYIQPKLDGLRADNFEGRITSRNGKPYLSVPHLYQSVARLDGELYNHDYHDDFNKIVSLCKKQKPTEEELAESAEKVQFWAYDFPDHPGTFSERFSALKDCLLENKFPGIKLVKTLRVKSPEDIKKQHEIWLSEGYEGTIVRVDNCKYENKRSKSLLKFKDFIDEEFKIIDVIEGEGGRTGTIGKFIMDLGENGKTFKSNVKGNFEYLRFIWENRKKYIGKSATVKYFQRTPDNIPRFPYVIKIDRDEYE